MLLQQTLVLTQWILCFCASKSIMPDFSFGFHTLKRNKNEGSSFSLHPVLNEVQSTCYIFLWHITCKYISFSLTVDENCEWNVSEHHKNLQHWKKPPRTKTVCCWNLWQPRRTWSWLGLYSYKSISGWCFFNSMCLQQLSLMKLCSWQQEFQTYVGGTSMLYF